MWTNKRWVLAVVLLVPTPLLAATTCSGGNVALTFGTYDFLAAAPLDAQGTLVVTCTRDGGPPSTTVTVGLGPSGTTGSIQSRALQGGGGGDRLAYNVYLDATRLQVWGETAGTDTASQALNVPNKGSASASFTFFGRLFAGQDVKAGFYSDSLLVTVSF